MRVTPGFYLRYQNLMLCHKLQSFIRWKNYPRTVVICPGWEMLVTQIFINGCSRYLPITWKHSISCLSSEKKVIFFNHNLFLGVKELLEKRLCSKQLYSTEISSKINILCLNCRSCTWLHLTDKTDASVRDSHAFLLKMVSE